MRRCGVPPCLLLLLLLVSPCLSLRHDSVRLADSADDERLCSVYDPFKVLPDNNKFQIGGSFPLHEGDCRRLRPDTVQEIVAIQWALTHWNQNSQHENAKMGLFAGDTCSRSREALSQSLRFLDSVGYHEPKECRTEDATTPSLLGVIAPKDFNSSLSLGTMLSVADLPVAAYSLPAATALIELDVANVVSTVPTISVYVDTFIRVMSQLRSNLVTVVDEGGDSFTTRRVVAQLRAADIFVAEVIPMEHPPLAQTIEDSDSNIVLALLTKQQLLSTLSRADVPDLAKLWVWLPVDGETLTDEETKTILPAKAKLEIMVLQTRGNELPQFRDYFLRVLKNNYESYQLLTSYVQQVYDCTGSSCALEKSAMQKRYRQARTTDSVIRMTYAFAAVGSQIANNKEHSSTCKHSSPDCTALIMRLLTELDFEFGAADPAELTGQRLSFTKTAEGVLLADGLSVDAVQLNDSPYKVLEYTTGKRPQVIASPLKAGAARLRSLCAPYRPFCGHCPSVIPVSGDRHFLSIPRHYPLYLLAMFDFHGGVACDSYRDIDISLPLAFVHTVWTFKQRFPELKLLEELDMGALLVDSCSSGRQAIETVVRAETQCFRFPQAGRNITIVPGSVFGYMSALHGDTQEGVKGYFSAGDTDAALVTVDADNTILKGAFSAMPTARNQALALLRLLNRLHWQFVTVALSEQDPDSLAAFRHFERLALDRGVCLAEVINLSGSNGAAPLSASTTVTVVFATAQDAAAYLKQIVRGNKRQVHVLLGDAHDFGLHMDEASRQRLVGTVSLQPRDILYADFRQWLDTTTPLSLPELWFWNHVESQHGCALSQKSKLVYGKMCTGDELLDVSRMGRMTKSGYLARGVERFLFAMDAAYKKLCPQQTGMCIEFYEKGRRMIADQLARVNVEDDVDVYEFVPSTQGEQFELIGNWSQSGGLRLATAYRTFGEDAAVVSHCEPPMCKCFLDGDFFQRPLDSFVMEEEAVSSDAYVKKQPAFGADVVAYESVFEHLSSGEWRQRPVNFVLLAVVTLKSAMALAVLVLVLVKCYLRVVKGNQSLGITLLVGIITLYITAYFFIFDATDMVCRLRVVLHGLGYTLCFGVMIAKGTQLRNAETLGFANAVHISFWNYWLLLFFIAGVQLALSVRWLAEPFMSTLSGLGEARRMVCTLGREEFALASVYVVVLLGLALFINCRNRNIKRNYKETKWLFLSSIGCTVVFVAWLVAYFVVPYNYRETVIVIELIASASIMLGCLFGPKIYILLSYEPVVVEYKPEQAGAPELFERDEESPRAVSPASSTDSGHRSASTYSNAHPLRVIPSGMDEPIFHTVMRKKVKRSHSEHDAARNQVRCVPDVPVLRSPTRSDH